MVGEFFCLLLCLCLSFGSVSMCAQCLFGGLCFCGLQDVLCSLRVTPSHCCCFILVTLTLCFIFLCFNLCNLCLLFLSSSLRLFCICSLFFAHHGSFSRYRVLSQ